MKPTLRIVVSVLTGLSVVIVAATVVAIASSIYTNAALALGKTYATQLGLTGAGQTETFLRSQHDIIFTSRISIATLPKLQLTADDPDFDIRSVCTILKSVFRATNYTTMQTYSIVFDDGGQMTIFYSQLANGTNVFRCSITSTYGIVPGNRGTNSTDIAFDARTNYEYDSYSLFGSPATTDYLVNPSASGNAYLKYISQLDDTTAWWSPTIAYKRSANAVPELLFPLVVSQFNTTGNFVGFIFASISIKYLSQVLKSLDYNSPHSHSFAINSDGFIFGTSHPNPTQKITYQNPNAPYDTQLCRSSASITSFPISGIICPVLPQDFGFAPLAALMKSNPDILKTPATFTLDMDVERRSYSVHGYKMNVPGRFFYVSMFFFIDFDEIVADVKNSRNIVVGVGCGLLVAGVVASALALYFILKPLEIVARKMNATSRLQMTTPELDDDDDENQNQNGVSSSPGSSIQEIFAIEVAYSQMHNAFDAFTRYVPIDIVKRLLIHGEKFRVGVHPVNATLLVSDLMNFTSICERQSPSEVANALKVFFELMSDVIVLHEGLIIQYIGDAIVAAWGALTSCEFQQVKACLAALMMNRETSLPTLHDVFDSMGERIVVRIGLNCGSVLSGTIGGGNRLAFTVLGTPCDFASTLEGLNKKFGTRIMIGPAMVEHVSEFFCLRALGCYDASFNGKKPRLDSRSHSRQGSKQSLPPAPSNDDDDRDNSSSIQLRDNNNNNNSTRISGLLESSGVLGNMQTPVIRHQNNNNRNQNNSNITMMEIQEFTGCERIYELVGCLPIEIVELSNLAETKNKRTSMLLLQRANSLNYNNPGSPTQKDEGIFTRENEMKYVNHNNNNNDTRVSMPPSSDYSSAFDDQTDVASTLSSAMKKKNITTSSAVDTDDNSEDRRTKKKKPRLTARALFETAFTFSRQFIVATESEILFCNEFNAIVDSWNHVEVPLVSAKKIVMETNDDNNNNNNNIRNSSFGKNASIKIYSNSSTESSVVNIGAERNSKNEKTLVADNCANDYDSAVTMNDTTSKNNIQNNNSTQTPRDAISALRNLREKYPAFFQETETAAQRLNNDLRCVSSFMYSHKTVERIFGRKVRRAVFKENYVDDRDGSDNSAEEDQ